jgi:hypothetical protein
MALHGSSSSSSSSSAAFRGCRVKKGSNQTAANYSTATAISWDSEDFDTDAIHDTSSNQDRLTVPSGVSYVEVGFGVVATSVTASNSVKANVTKNGTDIGCWVIDSASSSGTLGTGVNGSTGPLAVSPGDIFRVVLQCADTSIDISAALSFAWMKILQ